MELLASHEAGDATKHPARAHGRPYTKLLVVMAGVETLIQTEVTEVLP